MMEEGKDVEKLIEDRIVLIRFIFGIIYGIIAYILYRLNLSLFFDLTTTIWVLAAAAYFPSIVYVEKRMGKRSLYYSFARGILTYYLTWIVIAYILYDLFG